MFAVNPFPGGTQTRENPILFYLDYQRNPVADANIGYSYIEAIWKDGKAWHAQVFMVPEKKLIEDFYYADKERKIKEGRFLGYYTNGMMSDSGRYSNNQLEGNYYEWYSDGEQKALHHYHRGIRVDTCVNWRKDGSLAELSITDSLGNGLFEKFYESGAKLESGRLLNGKKQGTCQVFASDGKKMMEILYQGDSALQMQCFDEGGKLKSGACIYEKPPEFPGGVNGWKSYLEENLKYPNVAIRKEITGVVKVQFQVAKDGALSDFEILTSPHESLSNEVLRLMKMSPKWEPAVQYNKRVAYKHVQAITFRLE
jgi:TonB family protein